MRNIKIIIASLSVFTLLTACGQFESNLKSSSSGEVIAPERVTDPLVDVDLASEFQENFLGANSTSSAELMGEIAAGAFEITIDVSSTRAGDTLNKIVATLQGFDCDKHLSYYNTDISFAGLRSQELQNLGTSGQHQLQLKCTNNTCSEMAAVLMQKNSSGNTIATVLYALAGLNKSLKPNGTGYSQQFVVQRVNINGYGTSGTVEDKRIRCNSSEFSTGPTARFGSGSSSGSVNPTSGSGFTQSTESNAFGTGSNLAPFNNFDTNQPF